MLIYYKSVQKTLYYNTWKYCSEENLIWIELGHITEMRFSWGVEMIKNIIETHCLCQNRNQSLFFQNQLLLPVWWWSLFLIDNTMSSWRTWRKMRFWGRTSTSSEVMKHTSPDRTFLKLIFSPYSYENHVSCTDASKIPVESDTDDDGAPRISLAEMLEDLSLNDATGGEGADMMTDSWTYELASGVRCL